jgi:2,3-bisphosphoglycerate-independent phosphoglycerate mutase
LLALEDVALNEEDLAFRANMVCMENGTLVSYSADCIPTDQSRPLVDLINQEMKRNFADFELYHNCDFRNTLVVRSAGVSPLTLRCPEPHENHGREFDISALIEGTDASSDRLAKRLNRYLEGVARLLEGEAANMLFPWSPSVVLKLTPFHENVGFEAPVAIVGCMDFLHGIAKAGKLDFFKIGNGQPQTDYAGKGAKTVELLDAGHGFVICHINGPDEAAHMGQVQLKIESLENIDEYIVGPVLKYFEQHSDELGGVMIVPDHFTNYVPNLEEKRRIDVHSADPVPFALWNGRERDAARYYSEDDVLIGKYASPAVSHLDLLRLLGVAREQQVYLRTSA